MVTRREILSAGAVVAGGLTVSKKAQASANGKSRKWESSYSGQKRKAMRPGKPGRDYQPVTTPGNTTLPYKIVDGVKVFHLIAEEVEHEFCPGLKATCWGYNGRVHGPTIEAVEGDKVRVYVTNRLIAPTTVHWHGVFLPSGMDGVGGLNQAAIKPGETFMYEWTFRQHGTFMYHSHHDEMTQMALGMMGMIVVHPRRPDRNYRVDRDFVIMLSEWSIKPGTSRPNSIAMNDFNVLTMNARAFPGTEALVCKKGDRVRIRLGNLSAMDHHSIHLHGHYFKVVATDGGQIPVSAQWPETTVIVPTGASRDIEFIASEEGDWAFHCHMTHHGMNQMGHNIPNMIGANIARLNEQVRPILPEYMAMGHNGMGDHVLMEMPAPPNSIPMLGAKGPHGGITMGGMFSIVKVREKVSADYRDPGWYNAPKETIAKQASAEALKKDGIII